MTTLIDFALEISPYGNITNEELEKAAKSKVNTRNSVRLRQLLNGWIRCTYDEDIDVLIQEIKNIINAT